MVSVAILALAVLAQAISAKAILIQAVLAQALFAFACALCVVLVLSATLSLHRQALPLVVGRRTMSWYNGKWLAKWYGGGGFWGKKYAPPARRWDCANPKCGAVGPKGNLPSL